MVASKYQTALVLAPRLLGAVEQAPIFSSADVDLLVEAIAREEGYGIYWSDCGDDPRSHPDHVHLFISDLWYRWGRDTGLYRSPACRSEQLAAVLRAWIAELRASCAARLQTRQAPEAQPQPR